MIAPHNTYDEKAFWRAFANDLRSAKALVIIQSPFITARRIEKLRAEIEDCQKRRVTICAFIQETNARTTDAEQRARNVNTEAAISLLRSLGVHITSRASIHEKLATIDDDIFWEGSLNILSHNDTHERMNRWVSKDKVLEVIRHHKLGRCGSCMLPIAGKADWHKEHWSFIGNAIKRQREEMNITQVELASRCGLNVKRISEIEHGSADTRSSTLLKVCRELGLILLPAPWYLQPTIAESVKGKRK